MDFTYAQCISIDMRCSGLTKKQAVHSYSLRRRIKKAFKNIQKNHIYKCRIERRIWNIESSADTFKI